LEKDEGDERGVSGGGAAASGRFRQAPPDRMSSHHNTSAVVLEIGTWYTKCGFAENQNGAAEGAPRLIVQKRMPQMMQADLSGKVVLDAPKLTVPRSIAEWKPLLRQHLDVVLFSHLLCNPKDRRVVVVEDMLAPKNFRQALAECLFDLRVPSVLFAPSSLLAILTSGSRTGVVVDMGAEEVRVLPVYDGVPMLSAYTTSQLGSGPSQEMHKLVVSTLDGRRKQSLSATMREDIVARCCVVPPRHAAKVADLQSELLTSRTKNSAELNAWIEERLELAKKLAELAPDSAEECVLPGVGTLSGAARSAPAVVLFDGDEEGDSVPSLIVKALLACPADIRKDLLGNVLLCGGHAMIPGISGRLLNSLENEMKKVVALSAMRPAVRISRPAFSANTLGWIGGAMVGCDKNQVAAHSMTLEAYQKSKETAKERSEEHLRNATYDEIERFTQEMGLEMLADEDIMKANLRDAMRDPEAQLPDWTRLVPGSTATPGWYFRKRDESEGREWTKRDEPLDGKSGLSGTWQRDVDGAAGSGWMRLSDNVAAILEAGLRTGLEKVQVVVPPAGTDTVPLVSPEQAKDPARGKLPLPAGL
jgi:actin-related protein 10